MKNFKQTKVLYVVNARIPNDKAHGIQIINTCEAIGATGVDLTLVTPTFFGKKKTLKEQYRISQSFRHKKILAIDIPNFPWQFQLRSFSFFITINFYLIYELFSAIVSRRKLVIYARGEVIFSLLPFTFLASVFFETHQIRNYPNLYKIALKRVAGIVVITDRLKKKFIEEYKINGEKILVARDSVDMKKFSQVMPDKNIWRNHNISPDKKIVLYTGSLGLQKGVGTLADAANLLPNNVQVIFIGGNEKHAENFREKYKSLLNVSVLGHIDHELIPSYIAAADVLVLPDMAIDTYSNLYTSPMKLFEYMASGCVIVSSDVPSLREVLAEDCAIFFQSGDKESLAIKIEAALSDGLKSEQLGKNAQTKVTDFTWTKRGEAIIEHIKNVFK